MAAKTVQLTAPTGATVSVDSDKVEGLLGRGFTEVEAKKTTAKKASSSKSSK